MHIVGADAVRAAIAAHVLRRSIGTERLGDITLHPHQRDAVERILRLLESHRGALLADEVGLGKTFVALAVARRARSTLVIAPAALRVTWLSAAERANVAIRFASAESLGRSRVTPIGADLIIIDESHHLRSRATNRYTAARMLCASSNVLCLSATPVQNSSRDLRNVLSLFLGERANAISTEDAARFIVRRTAADIAPDAALALPTVASPRWVRSVSDTDCLDRLLALPAPVPPSDGGDGGVLVTYSLVRQWASSRASLRAALMRRLARARALQDSLAEGRWPSRAELAAWRFADGAQQLTFPEMVVAGDARNCATLLQQVQLHADSVRELTAWLHASPDPDPERAERLLGICGSHAGERVVVFSEYAETIAAMFRALMSRARVAMLTHGGGRVAGGPIGRAALLSQFGPLGRANDADRVDVLLTTDVLSEGVDLQRASVVIHLDLAWNPARLEQRVGRLRRIGALRDRVAVYAFAPPAPAERLLRLEQRLRVKLGIAAGAVGLAGAIVPGLTVDNTSPVEHAERLRRALRDWERALAPTDGLVAAAVRSSADAALACVRRAGEIALIAIVDGRVDESAARIAALIEAASGPDADASARDLQAVVESARAWLARTAVTGVVELPSSHVARSRHLVLRRADAIARRVGRHDRARLTPMLGTARRVATATLSAGAERVLDELACALMSDVAWLQSVGQFAALHARGGAREPDEILAVLLLRR